uniref:Uncharacterized protein n=1 Tax=Tanacetum cinerariifolium TaxID=118510 RepID=A0A699HB51_TANCI|nr:hypothetical protein [Tanacetum cinerariifolium]
MPSRHRDTNVSDEFPVSYNEDHTDLVRLWDPEGKGNSFSLKITYDGLEARENKEKFNLEKAKAKRDDDKGEEAPKKKIKKKSEHENLMKVVMDVPASSSNAGADAAPSNVTPSTQPNAETATNAPS